MAYSFDDSKIDEMIQVFENNFDEPMRALVEIVLNNLMLIERDRHNQASSHERSLSRRDSSNGFKPKKYKTRLGAMDLRVPQTRYEPFYPSCLEKGIRSERALKLAIAEMYVQGVSTRKVQHIVEEMSGMNVTSTEVSRCAKLLDTELRNGVIKNLVESSICISMPDMKRCAMKERSLMLQSLVPLESTKKAKSQYLESL